MFHALALAAVVVSQAAIGLETKPVTQPIAEKPRLIKKVRPNAPKGERVVFYEVDANGEVTNEYRGQN